MHFGICGNAAHSTEQMGPTCGELKAGKTTCIRAVLALFLTGLQLCLPNRALLINAHAHYNNRHKMMY